MQGGRGGGEGKKKILLKDEKKKFYPQVLDLFGRWTGKAFLFEDGLSVNKRI